MDLKIKHLILGVSSLILIFAYAFYIPSPVKSAEELSRVKFGFPIAFIQQDMTCQNSFAFYPNYFRFSPKLYKDCSVKNFSLLGLVASFLTIFLVLEAAVYILEILNFQLRKIFSKKI